MYPSYTKSERVADGSMHVVGVTGAVLGAILLLAWAAPVASPWQIAAITIYAITLIATFAASAFYHMTPWESLRPTLRRIDHAAIYLKIAGTYTPLVVMIGSGLAYVVLGIVWALALIGMVLKLVFWSTPGRFGPALYLAMGWLSVVLFWSSWQQLPFGYIVAGGLLYTVGVVFYAAKKMKFSNAIWHGFVIAASACFFAAISLSVTQDSLV
ncbi:channel protein (hemolysin III family) [Hoeflea halophila]|uniref:Channel protein (Hemolysin III family) n=1 Tax=Hoeflea halophila TaxID=714899 RepID=A0A286IBU5_9HYPH|nr:hemolysin III family protein [Hoeflea halophila]SOE16839.1 channel protein (hemolysin III family) [Hoeflea halophila]